MIPLVANAGSALLWLEWGHLVCGNAVIGLVEAAIVCVVFRAPFVRALKAMVVANYVSMIAGALVVRMSGGLWPGLSPREAFWALLASVLGLWAATVAIEAPFIRWAMKEGERRWPRALRASLLVQTLSYAALVPLYLDAGAADVLLRTSIVDAAGIAPAARAHVWFLDEDAVAVWRVSLSGGAPERVAVAGGDLARLEGDAATGVIRVWRPQAGDIPVSGRIVPRAAFDDESGASADPATQRWRIDRKWRAGDWLRAEESATAGRSVRLHLQTPFLWWPATDATLVPGSAVVVYALGPHVVALDLDTMRLAVLGEGRSPIVTLDER